MIILKIVKKQFVVMHLSEFLVLEYLLGANIGKHVVLCIFRRLNKVVCPCGLAYQQCAGGNHLNYACKKCDMQEFRNQSLGRMVGPPGVTMPYDEPKKVSNTWFCQYCNGNFCDDCYCKTVNSNTDLHDKVPICPKCIASMPQCTKCDGPLHLKDEYGRGLGVYRHDDCQAELCARCYKYSKINYIQGNYTVEVCPQCRKFLHQTERPTTIEVTIPRRRKKIGRKLRKGWKRG